MPVAEKEDVPKVGHPIFSRHETFPPRNGWLKKGFDAIKADPEVFNREDAAILLGVGKNMAKAIRYWCLAFKLVEEKTDKATRTKTLVPTLFGNSLLGKNGWDPYLEDVGSLWLLHWELLKRPGLATTWDFAFNQYRHPEFTQDDFLNELSEYAKQTWPDTSFSEATLKNDVSCFARMYSKDDVSKNVSEETISSPFAELNLLTRLAGGKHLAFHIGSKKNLPIDVIAAACFEYTDSCVTTERSISISKLLYGIGSPGLAFKLPESTVYGALDVLAAKRKDDLSISQTAGMIQLQFTKDPSKIASSILNDYYGSYRRT